MSDVGDQNIPSSGYVAFEREVLHDNIALCDQKSGVLLALSAVLVIFALQSLPVPKQVEDALGSGWLLLVLSLSWLGIGGFTLAAYLSLHVIVPRFVARNDDHIFWGADLFKLEPPKFLARIRHSTESTLGQDMALHLHSLAQICSEKYLYFGWALYVGQLSFVAIVLAEVLRVLA